MAQLTVFNTLSKKQEIFSPITPGRVSMYACGPTVYDYMHIGNLRTYIFEDILKRVLTYLGYQVTHIMNITDVGHLVSDADDGEDKMMKALRREGLEPSLESLHTLARLYTNAFMRDMEELRIIPPQQYTKATEHVSEMIALIQQMEQRGFTYELADAVYFDTSKFPDYGKMANLQNMEIKEGARIGVHGQKRNPTDFALWIKAVDENEHHVMQWPSPWGIGFPGWHIECSAMSMKYLGERFDIHCGGIDHIPVHHTNEIAQNEAAVGHSTVHYWLHGEFLTIDEKRMGKSMGNFITLQRVIEEGYPALTFRYLMLQTHYRQRLNFSWPALDAARNAYQNLLSFCASGVAGDTASKDHMSLFLEAICDDLNMPKALAVVWDVVRHKELPLETKLATVKDFDAVLGLGLFEQQPSRPIPAEVAALADARQQARVEKDWQRADDLRKEIEAAGYEVRDTTDGYVVTPKV